MSTESRLSRLETVLATQSETDLGEMCRRIDRVLGTMPGYAVDAFLSVCEACKGNEIACLESLLNLPDQLRTEIEDAFECGRWRGTWTPASDAEAPERIKSK